MHRALAGAMRDIATSTDGDRARAAPSGSRAPRRCRLDTACVRCAVGALVLAAGCGRLGFDPLAGQDRYRLSWARDLPGALNANNHTHGVAAAPGGGAYVVGHFSSVVDIG